MPQRTSTEKLMILFFVLFFIIFIKLVNIQLIERVVYQHLAENNKIKVVPILAPRGRIIDRAGHVLAEDKASFNLVISLDKIKDYKELEKVLSKLSNILGIPKSLLLKKIKNKKNALSSSTITLFENMKYKYAIKLFEHMPLPESVQIQIKPTRIYPNGDLAAHVIGYVEKGSNKLQGEMGVEKAYDEVLSGKNGGVEIEIDALGRQRRILSEKEVVPGADIVLTIDKNIQAFTEEVIKERTGAAVIINADTGEILAMVSQPSFNLNIFLHKKNIDKLLNSPLPIIFNRAMQGEYSMGSIFKIVIALAGLEENIINDDTKFFCNGKFICRGYQYACLENIKHYNIDVKEAIVHSCNVFFYQLGLKVGINNIIKYAKKLGIGRPTGVDLPYEKAGFIGTPLWKKRKYKESWFPGDTIVLSIGQGYLLTTLLQVSKLFMHLFSSKEYICSPHVVKKIIFPNNEIKIIKPKVENKFPISPQIKKLLKDALKGVVERGTGWQAYLPNLEIMGKTGTAEMPGKESHAWFVCFVKIKNIPLIITLLIEHSGKGGAIAAPLVKQLIQNLHTYLTYNERY